MILISNEYLVNTQMIFTCILLMRVFFVLEKKPAYHDFHRKLNKNNYKYIKHHLHDSLP